MPKRINNIFYSKLTLKNIIKAYERAIKGKNDTKEVILYKMDLSNNIKTILLDIYNKTYKPGIYRRFVIYEPKKREIMALPFKDRIVHQWYVEEYIKPIFMPKFINETYACIPERGLHLAIKKLFSFMKSMYIQKQDFYILKCDIRKFFYSINKQILFNIISRYVKDKDFLEFTKKIIYDGTGKTGIPIGNYTSQFFANIYLNELDHYVKQELKVKYYLRYMDDFILLLDNKQECIEKKLKIEKFLNEKLLLNLNEKTNYFKSIQGVNFCGYRIFRNKILLKKQNKKNMYKKVKIWNKLYKINKLNTKLAGQILTSWEGHASHSSSEHLVEKVKQKCDWLYK